MKEKIYRFMQGRYGMDGFSNFLIAAALVLAVLDAFTGTHVLNLLAWVLLIFAYSRIFSRNHSRCVAQNVWFYNHTKGIRTFYQKQKSRMKIRKTHHIYKCKQCGQKIKIPKGKGKIIITCPNCRNEFIKRS